MLCLSFLDRLGGRFGSSWGSFGVIFGRLGGRFGRLGGSLEGLGEVLGGVLRVLGGVDGPCWAKTRGDGKSLAQKVRQKASSWRPKREPKRPQDYQKSIKKSF